MKKSKLLCVFLAIVLMLGLASSGFAISLDEDSDASIVTDKDISEEKVFSTATLEDDFAEDRIIVSIKNVDSLKLKTYTAADFPEIKCVAVEDLTTAYSDEIKEKLSEKNVRTDSLNCQDVLSHAEAYDFDVTVYHQILLLILPKPGKQNVLDAIKLVMQRDDVVSAGPDYRWQLSTTPNDTNYSSQSAAANQMKLPQAWDIETGKVSVEIGVIDTGIYGAHSDLQNRVDVSRSRNCLFFTQTVTTVIDYYGHGTKVAGIIGAQGNNSKGISGVAWNCTLISLCAGENSYLYTSAIVRAIEYAQNASIPILNLSAASEHDDYDYDIYLAIQQYPGLLVCAAGNNGDNNLRNIDNTPIYPAAYDLSNILTVGSCESNDTLSSFSNYGANSVDIFALGSNVYSTTHSGGYGADSGTSFAAPYVSGVAALLKSECSIATTAKIKSCIINYDDNVSGLSSKCVSGGRLNAYKAVSNIHSYTHTKKNASYHTSTCPCGVTNTLEHYFIAMGNRQMCTDCGYMT